MKEEGFVNVESMEVLVRNLEARTGMTRPSQIMVAHTCYLTFGRKTEGVADTREEAPEEPATEEQAAV